MKFYLTNHKVVKMWSMNPMPSIRVKVIILVNHFLLERQIRYIPLKIRNLVIVLICPKSLPLNVQTEIGQGQ